MKNTIMLCAVLVSALSAAAQTEEIDEPVIGGEEIELTEDELRQLEEEENRFRPNPQLQRVASVTSKYTEPVQDSPASVWVVGREEIRNGQYRNLAEILGQVPGVFVTYDYLNYHIGMRGALGGARAGSRYLKIMIDGVPMPVQQSETYLLGSEFIPVSAIERVEVLRGPASALYGAGAFVGAVNVVTRRSSFAGENQVKGSVNLYGGAPGILSIGTDTSLEFVSRDLHILGAFSLSGEDRSTLGVGLSHVLSPNEDGILSSSSSPFTDRYETENGTPLTSTDDYALLGSAVLKLEANLGKGVLRAMALSQLSLRDAEFHDISKLTGSSSVRLINSKLDLSYESPLFGQVSGKIRASYGNGGTLPGDQLRIKRTDPFVIQRTFSANTLSAAAEARYDLTDGGFVLVGIDSYLDLESMPEYIEKNDDVAVEDFVRSERTDEQLTNVAGFVHGVLPVTDWLNAAGGARVDYHSVVKIAGAARGGLVAKLGERLNVKLLGGSSYKAPSPEQLFSPTIAGTTDIYGNPNALPQYMVGGELSVDYFPTEWLYLSAAGFYNYYIDVLAYVSTGGELRATNYNASNPGGEIASRLFVPFGEGYALEMNGVVSAQYTAVESTDLGGLVVQEVPDNEGVPVLVTNAGFSLKTPALRFGVDHRYVSRRTPSQSNLLENGTASMGSPNYFLSAYHVVNAVVSTRTIDFGSGVNARFSLRGTNLLGFRTGDDAPFNFTEIGFNGVDIPAQPMTIWLTTNIGF